MQSDSGACENFEGDRWFFDSTISVTFKDVNGMECFDNTTDQLLYMGDFLDPVGSQLNYLYLIVHAV
jgi:hypothetical protein